MAAPHNNFSGARRGQETGSDDFPSEWVVRVWTEVSSGFGDPDLNKQVQAFSLSLLPSGIT